jgi:3-hydroxyacyl-CoA dehydrogenase
MVKGMARNFPAPAKCVDAVEASVKRRFDDGMAYERDLFISLMMTPECKALRHAFFGERAASKIPDVPEDTPQRKVARVAVIGAGTMGGGISMNFLNAGIPVTILEMKQDALDRGVATIRKNYEGQVKKGKLKQDKLDARMALLSTTLQYKDIADADLVIEAVFEEMGRQGKSLQDAGRGDEDRRHPRQQHQHAGRECHRRLHEAAAGRDRHCTSSAPPT